MAQKSIVPLNEFAFDDGSQIIDAIRSGCVDAFVVEERDGHAVYTLANSDLPYSTLVQRMQQGAAMLNATGHIMYGNPSLATLLGTSSEAIVGLRFNDLIETEDHPAFQKLFDELQNDSSECELRLRRFDESVIPARISLTTLSRDKSVTGILVSDLTSEKSYAELASRLQSLEDEERKKIARELHDSVGQLLVALGMNLSRLRNETPNLSTASTDLLSDCSGMVDEVSREIRTISHLLHPPLLDVAGLESAIRWYVDGFSHRSNIKVELQTDSELGRLPSEVEISLFRVVQECLTNVYRHSGSDFCSISMKRNGNFLFMEIRDTGHGMRNGAEGEIPAGVGLRGMQERLRRLSGTLQIHSTENGTVVNVVVPVPGKSETNG
jgi:PAS domain S-box-containing protein